MPIVAARASICAISFVAASLAITGCQRKTAAPPTMPPPKVTVTNPASYPVQSYFEYNGHLESVETVEVRARIKGLLQEVHFDEGEEVTQGAKLYTIDPREYRSAVARSMAELAKAAADIDNWKAQIKLAETDLSRFRKIGGAVSQSEIDKAAATVEVNIAQLAAAQAHKESAAAALQTANIQLGYTDITTPIAGRISRTLVTKGNLVGQDQPTLLTTIVSMDPLYVYFDVPERDLIEYQRALRAQTTASPASQEAAIEVGVATEEGFPHHGNIDFRENRVDVGTGTVRIRGRIPNPPAPPTNARILYPGLYAKVRVPSGAAISRPVIPEEALMTGQEGRYVYVLGPGDVVEKRAVTVGTRVWQAPASDDAGAHLWVLANTKPTPPATEKGPAAPPAPVRQPIRAMVAIDRGLAPTDRIIVSGLQKARPGTSVAPDVWELRGPPVVPPAAPAAR